MTMMNLKRRRSEEASLEAIESPISSPSSIISSSSYEDIEYDNSIPRSGKWTPEEERFADRLIRDFELGLLPDCEDGCTLRSYLAKKLNCAPMRISKKYAGQCIGKHVFCKRIGADRRKMLAYYEEQQQQNQPFKMPRVDDSYVFNYDLYRPTEQSFQFETYSHEPTIMGRFDSVSSDSSNDNGDNLSCTTNEYDETSSNSDAEAAEWRDVLSFFCGDFDDKDIAIDFKLYRGELAINE